MALLAGMRITAARLWRAMGEAQLTTSNPAATATYYQWGTEEVDLGNPGVPVAVMAHLTGRANAATTTAAGSTMTVRLGISLNNGTTWHYGVAVTYELKPSGTGSVNYRSAVPVQAYFAGTPSSNILVRAEYQSGSTTDMTVNGGHITAYAVAT